MDKSLRYWGEFHSKNGMLWRTEIWQKPEKDKNWEVSRMTFPQNSPLEIEWSSVDKITPLQPSNATLNVVSETDRKYIDLYILDPGSVLLKVFRAYEHTVQTSADAAPNDYLYWSGTLDTELYEEPFSEKFDYEVSLTFSDFAILERMNYLGEKSLINVEKLLWDCLLATQLNSEPTLELFIDKRIEKHISTAPSSSGQRVLTHDYILGNNFYDETDEPCTLKDVLESILQPYALRLIQKAGKFIFYDLNAMYREHADPEPVKWASTEATLGIDKIYNNVKLTFSPYEITKILEPQITVEKELDQIQDEKNPNFQDDIYLGYGDDSGLDNILGFQLYCQGKGKGVEIGESAKFFKIEPMHNGNETTGVLWSYLRGKKAAISNPAPEWMPKNKRNNMLANLLMPDKGTSYSDALKDLPVVFRTEPIYLPDTKGLDVQYLNVSLPLLFDARYNPFTDASESNEESNNELIRKRCNYAYVPAELEILNAEGKTICFYSNIRNIFPNTKNYISGSWIPLKEGEELPGQGHLWLAYYSNSAKHKENTGLSGWVENRQACHPTSLSLPAVYTKTGGKGEFLRLPLEEGYLRLTIYGGISICEIHKIFFLETYRFISCQDTHRWWAYKAPSIELYDNYMKEPKKSDLEIVAYLNKSAKEDLEIETIVGTRHLKKSGLKKSVLFTGRGLLRKGNGELHYLYNRAGKEDYMENLLINTIYSQYATRHVKLSGTVELLPDFGLYTDHSESGRYIVLSEVQNPMEDESNISMVQVGEEVYHKVDSITES